MLWESRAEPPEVQQRRFNHPALLDRVPLVDMLTWIVSDESGKRELLRQPP